MNINNDLLNLINDFKTKRFSERYGEQQNYYVFFLTNKNNKNIYLLLRHLDREKKGQIKIEFEGFLRERGYNMKVI